jgi:hypothetical protein
MLGSIFKVFFGNIFAILGWIIILTGIFVISFNAPVGIGMIIFGVLLISISTILKRR